MSNVRNIIKELIPPGIVPQFVKITPHCSHAYDYPYHIFPEKGSKNNNGVFIGYLNDGREVLLFCIKVTKKTGEHTLLWISYNERFKKNSSYVIACKETTSNPKFFSELEGLFIKDSIIRNWNIEDHKMKLSSLTNGEKCHTIDLLDDTILDCIATIYTEDINVY